MLEDNILFMNYGYVIGLDQIGKHDIKIAGGKGANIGEMIKSGIPVHIITYQRKHIYLIKKIVCYIIKSKLSLICPYNRLNQEPVLVYNKHIYLYIDK